MSKGSELAAQYAEHYGFEAQGDDESDHGFRSRVAGQLRDMGNVIEAHEALRNERYEQSDDVTAGIFGAFAQTLQGGSGRSGEQQLGDDIATGTVLRYPRKRMTPGEFRMKERLDDFEDT